MSITLYGIPNCDTIKRARAWLDQHGIDYHFHDYKKRGVDADKLAGWIDQAGWETVLNRAGATFKKLPDDRKAGLNAPKAVAIMVEWPSAIKRPIVEYDGGLLVGFKPDEWGAAKFPST